MSSVSRTYDTYLDFHILNTFPSSASGSSIYAQAICELLPLIRSVSFLIQREQRYIPKNISVLHTLHRRNFPQFLR